MKFQPKRFIVEVKRGTSRAAFSSPDVGTDKFSAAEAMLFGASAQPAAIEPLKTARSAAPPRRILESLAEATAEPMVAEVEEAVERPRRGRKPGSKNKPKVAAAPLAAPPPVLSAAAQAFMTASVAAKPAAGASSARPVPVPARSAAARSAAALPAAALPAAAPADPILVRPEPMGIREPRAAGAADLGEGRRGRLRERSNIIQRYVLGTAPQPGQTGSLRARKLARAAAAR